MCRQQGRIIQVHLGREIHHVLEHVARGSKPPVSWQAGLNSFGYELLMGMSSSWSSTRSVPSLATSSGRIPAAQMTLSPWPKKFTLNWNLLVLLGWVVADGWSSRSKGSAYKQDVFYLFASSWSFSLFFMCEYACVGVCGSWYNTILAATQNKLTSATLSELQEPAIILHINIGYKLDAHVYTHVR